MPIDDLNDYLHIQLVSDECDTISGFLINIMGKIPNNIEEKVIEYENIIFKIESIKEKRIEKIKICIQNDK